MSLKAKIRNIAKQKNMSAQVVLQNYMFERFLERLSKSPYKDKFVLKGGIQKLSGKFAESILMTMYFFLFLKLELLGGMMNMEATE